MRLRLFNKVLLWVGVMGALSSCQRGGSDASLEPLEPSSGEAREEAPPMGGAESTGEFYEESEAGPTSAPAEELRELPSEPGSFDTPLSEPSAAPSGPVGETVEEPAEALPPSDDASQEAEGL
ncbi:MAG: hypothetical protein ACO3JL_21605 [Myxococcota bacterium]